MSVDQVGESGRGKKDAAIFISVALVVLLLVAVGAYFALQRPRLAADNHSTDAADQEADTAYELRPIALPERPKSTTDGYVGSSACAACHQQEFDSYGNHPMAHSLLPVANARKVETSDHRQFAAADGRNYRVEQKSGVVVHHEIVVDQDQQLIYDLAKPVKYVLGSGRRGRSYLIYEGHHFYQSPIGWYSQPQKWDLSPGYNGTDHFRFSRRLGENCLYCHAGRTAPLESSEDLYGKTAFLESSIGCERCHGPGEQHIAFHSETPSEADEADPIVNPAHLEPAAAEAVCSQCHLSGESVILRTGKQHRDFRPGQRLEDTWVILVSGAEDRKEALSRAVSHVDQMRLSRCYSASAGTMNCVTCHDPHAVPERTSRELFFNQRCLKCHDQQGCALAEEQRLAAPAAGSCIQCHMPQFKVNDIPHTAGTDHRILRSRPQQEPQTTSSGPLNPTVFDDAETRLPRSEVRRALGLAMLEQNVVLADRQLSGAALQLLLPADVAGSQNVASIVSKVPDDIPVLKKLGSVLAAHGDAVGAQACWERIVEIVPHHEDARLLLALHNLESGDAQKAALNLRYLLGIDPQNAESLELKARVLEKLGDFPAAIAAAEQAVQVDPGLISAREWLAQSYQANGQSDKRQQQLSEIRRIKATLRESSIQRSRSDPPRPPL